MSDTVKADAWVATALGDPTKVLGRQQVEVRPPGPNEVRVEVSTFCVNFNDTDIVRGRWSVVPLAAAVRPGHGGHGRGRERRRRAPSTCSAGASSGIPARRPRRLRRVRRGRRAPAPCSSPTG